MVFSFLKLFISIQTKNETFFYDLALGTPIIRRLGQANTVAVGLLLYCIRFTAYYFLKYVDCTFSLCNIIDLTCFFPFFVILILCGILNNYIYKKPILN